MIRLTSVTFPINVQIRARPAPMLRDYTAGAEFSIFFDRVARMVVFVSPGEQEVVADASGVVMRLAPDETWEPRARAGSPNISDFPDRQRDMANGRPEKSAASAPAPAPSGRRQGR